MNKNVCRILNQIPRTSLIAKFHTMIKISNSGLKITYLGADFRKRITVIFEISILEFVKYMFYLIQ